jgi:hypothetical protein
MEKYNGMNIYRNEFFKESKQDLDTTVQYTVEITDAYFFQVISDKSKIMDTINKVGFNKNSFKYGLTRLRVHLKNPRTRAKSIIAIQGLDEITQFLYETESLGDLTKCKGTTAIKYDATSSGTSLGISIPRKTY